MTHPRRLPQRVGKVLAEPDGPCAGVAARPLLGAVSVYCACAVMICPIFPLFARPTPLDLGV